MHDPARTTSGKLMRSGRCLAGIAQARRWSAAAAARHVPRACRTLPARIGTWRRCPSCLRSSPAGSTARWERRHEPDRSDVELFFTERLITQRNASPRTIAAYRETLRLLSALRARADRQAALSTAVRRPRRAADRRVPHPSRARARQQHPDSQRAPGGDPLALPLRHPPPPRGHGDDRAGDRDSRQAA